MKPKTYPYIHWVVVEYVKRKQLFNGYKVIKIMRLSDNSRYKKVTLYKNLTETDAEAIMYKLERKINH